MNYSELQITAVIALPDQTITRIFTDVFELIEYIKVNNGVVMHSDKFIDWDGINLLYGFND